MLLRLVLSLAAAGPAVAQEIEGDGPSAEDRAPPLDDMVLGQADARVTVVEYASASCPHCAAFHTSHFGALKAAYIDKGRIRFVLREFPHNDAALAAVMVARCAPREQYFDYVHQFFVTQREWLKEPREGLWRIAQSFGMGQDVFERCLANQELAGAIHAGRALARAKGVSDTPTFFIDGELYRGEKTYEGLSAEIDRRLQR